MDWQQKAEALAGLSQLSIMFRERQWRIGGPEPWYVSQQVDIHCGSVLHGAFGNGFTPQEAIENHWQRLVSDLKPDQHLIVKDSRGQKRRAVRWNGFMWEDVTEAASRNPNEHHDR